MVKQVYLKRAVSAIARAMYLSLRKKQQQQKKQKQKQTNLPRSSLSKEKKITLNEMIYIKVCLL